MNLWGGSGAWAARAQPSAPVTPEGGPGCEARSPPRIGLQPERRDGASAGSARSAPAIARWVCCERGGSDLAPAFGNFSNTGSGPTKPLLGSTSTTCGGAAPQIIMQSQIFLSGSISSPFSTVQSATPSGPRRHPRSQQRAWTAFLNSAAALEAGPAGPGVRAVRQRTPLCGYWPRLACDPRR